MKNLVFDGDQVEFTAGAAYVSGAPVLIGERVGVVVNGVANGAQGTAKLKGVFELNKVSAQAWVQGDRIYWDVSLALFTNVKDTDTKFAGYAHSAAANPTATGLVLLAGPGPQAAVVTALAQDISATYVEAEVQAISTKVDAILTALKNSNQMASS